MAAPNMETITASLERSLQNCSLNNRRSTRDEDDSAADTDLGRSCSSDDVPDNYLCNSDTPTTTTTIELNSHVSLPYHWEQCLDLKTGEIYYVNWRNGMKAKQDPRTTAEYIGDDYYYSEEDSSYDSEESSSESFPSSREQYQVEKQNHNNNNNNNINNNNNNVLVVAGCKSCLMYFMVPKHVEDCPKCTGQLLHFDRSENGCR